MNELRCVDCGTMTPRRGASQICCPECSTARDRARKASWSASHKRPRTEEDRQAVKQRVARLRSTAEQRAGDGSIAWAPREMAENLAWIVRVAVPFDYAFSKNAVWSMRGGGGHVFLRKQASRARDTVRAAIASAIRGHNVVEAKVYIDIFVQKPDNRGDAINVVDSVCDGVKEAIGVDDRWFCIRGLDWEVVKTNPTIWIGVGQEATEHHRVCSYCGAIKPVTQFGRSKRALLGYGRVCVDCGRLRRATKPDEAVDV